jgi:hypothetical protein
MKNLFKHLFLLLFIVSCTNNDNFDEPLALSPKSVTDCDLTTDPTAVGLCIDGAKFALPNEIITYAAKFTSANCEFLWTIDSGDMEILNIEESIENGQKKSIATIKFNRDFIGSGKFTVRADESGNMNMAEMDYTVELEEL